MEYVSAHSPKWRTRTSISLMVLFEGRDSDIPFVAHADDTDEYNRELFVRASNGEFGEIDIARKGISEQVVKRIYAIRDNLTQTGGCFVDGHWYHSDTHSKLQQLSLLLAGENLPTDLKWKTMSGDKVILTPQLVQYIYQAQMRQEMMIFEYSEYLKSQAEQMEFPEELDIENNWPETYK